MSDSQHIERILRRYFAARTQEQIDALEFADNIELHGPMLPEPLHGVEAVREYLAQVTPFIARSEVLEIIIDRNSAAVRALTVSITGAEFEGGFFFRIFQGQISRVRNLFDTRQLMAGGAS
jgi:hypothetical protein